MAAPLLAETRPADLPKFEPAGAERFIRPDVHAGDRPVGASFASRSAVYGTHGAAGSAQPCSSHARRNGVNTVKGVPCRVRSRPGATA